MNVKVLCGTVMILAGMAAAQTNGEWSANRLPGTSTVWTAGRTAAELAAATAGLASHTSSAAMHLTSAQAARISAALTNENDTAAVAALAQYAATGTVRRLHVDASTWYEMQPGTATLYSVAVSNYWTVAITGVTYQTDAPYPIPAEASSYTIIGFSTIEAAHPQSASISKDGYNWGFDLPLSDTVTLAEQSFNEPLLTMQMNTVVSTNAAPYVLLTQAPTDASAHVTNTVIHVTGAERTAWNAGTNTAMEALTTADTAAGIINNHVFSSNPHAGYVVSPQALTNAINALTNAPAWVAATNLTASVTLTNITERPHYLAATGAVAVAFYGLRPPQPVYVIIRGPSSVSFPGAYIVGGGSWQTNMSNHFLVWKYGTNTLINPITATED